MVLIGFLKLIKVLENEGIDTTHNPEFTMLEAYQAYTDYNGMMDLMESMFDFVAKEVLGTTKVVFKGQEVDVAKPWARVTMLDSIKEHAGIDVSIMTVDQLQDVIDENLIEFEKEKLWGNYVLAIFEHYCEDKYINPTFIIDHPRESTPLCKNYETAMNDSLNALNLFVWVWNLGMHIVN